MSNGTPMKITAGHLIRALCSIEQWLKGIRKVLMQLPEDAEIDVSQHLPDWDWERFMGKSGGGNIPTVKGCPPPDFYESGGNIPEIKGCPPPDWYQEPCP
jgi:hypothetical protein